MTWKHRSLGLRHCKQYLVPSPSLPPSCPLRNEEILCFHAHPENRRTLDRGLDSEIIPKEILSPLKLFPQVLGISPQCVLQGCPLSLTAAIFITSVMPA